MSHSDEPISVIEDLDPEPSPGGGGRQLWEFVLGGLIILGILGFAGLQWLRSDAEQRNYQAGSDAAVQRDWDSAHSYFEAASGYRDADRQAQAAATTIARRDAQYDAAINDVAGGSWLACLQAIRQVDGIEPDYKDATRVESNATDQVYREAMSGTVVLRTNASPPGLYFYGQNGWVWLPHSDTYSRIEGSGSSDRLVYDVPGPGWTPVATPSPADTGYGGREMKGRQLVAARLPDLSQSDLSISINQGDAYNFQWGDNGFWATSYPSNDPTVYLSERPVRKPLFGSSKMTLTYQSFDSPDTLSTRIESESMGDTAVVMGLDPNSDRYLLATWSGEGSEGRVLTSTVTNLFLAHVGGDRRLLYSVTGGSFISAQFSPDGKHALLSAYMPFDDRTAAQDIFVLTLDGTSPARSVARTIIDMNDGQPEQSDNRLMTSFVGSGLYFGDIIVTEHDEDHNYIRLIDPNSGGDPLVVAEIPDDKPLVWGLFSGQKGEVLLVANEVPFADDPTKQTPVRPKPVMFVVLSPDDALKVTSLTVDWNSYLTQLNFATRVGERLVFSTFTCCDTVSSAYTSSVYSLPLSSLGIQGAKPATGYDQTAVPANDVDVYGWSGMHSFGANIFTYLSGSDLRASLYDGSIDIPLEQGITYMYNESENRLWQGPLQ